MPRSRGRPSKPDEVTDVEAAVVEIMYCEELVRLGARATRDQIVDAVVERLKKQTTAWWSKRKVYSLIRRYSENMNWTKSLDGNKD